MSGLLRRHARTLLGALGGALGGGLYAHFVGCRTGTCLLTSNVWTAALFFGLTGALALAPSAPRREGGAPPADPT
ncbi:MAG TPA: hypothetical protein VLT47_14920 [Anaeromyxobacteraceae bacterium]|nr:hypothetical protein [Anaeromyxobacteraceae bacterium]